MLYILFEGRLGNNLFQYAAARSLDKDVVICCPYKEYYENVMKFKDIFFHESKIMDYIPKNVYIWEQPDFKFTPPLLNNVNNNNICLKGYFQSYKYIDFQLIRNVYSIPTFLKNEIEFTFSNIINKPYIAMHVRRGDYMNVLYYYPFCGLKYYKDALKQLPQDIPVVVCSDDIEWCKRKFKESRFIFSENHSFLFDFFVQTMATYNIISNSSYSLWASFLNDNPNKIVCAPSLWFGFYSKDDTSEMLPPDYKIIKNTYELPILLKAYLQLYRIRIIKFLRMLKNKHLFSI